MRNERDISRETRNDLFSSSAAFTAPFTDASTPALPVSAVAVTAPVTSYHPPTVIDAAHSADHHRMPTNINIVPPILRKHSAKIGLDQYATKLPLWTLETFFASRDPVFPTDPATLHQEYKSIAQLQGMIAHPIPESLQYPSIFPILKIFGAILSSIDERPYSTILIRNYEYSVYL